MGFRGSVPAAGSGLRVPQDSQVARRGRGIHYQIQRLTVAQRAGALYKPGWANLVMDTYPVPLLRGVGRQLFGTPLRVLRKYRIVGQRSESYIIGF